MRTILRRRFVLPVLLALVAAVVGGLFAGLGGPEPARDTQAQFGQASLYFRFLPPVGDDNREDVKLTCGWHWSCLEPRDDAAAGYTTSALDFGSPHAAGGKPLYLRGYGHAPSSNISYQPVTVRVFDWPKGYTTGAHYAPINCYAVEAVFFWIDNAAIPHVGAIGRYAVWHAEAPDQHGNVYKPYFGGTGAWNGTDANFSLGTVLAAYTDSCGKFAAHAHVARDPELSGRPRPYSGRWVENIWRYPTEAEHHDDVNAICLHNKDRQNWTHQLLLAGSAPSLQKEKTERNYKLTVKKDGCDGGGGSGGPVVVPQATATERGSSTVSQVAAQDDAKANARAALPTGTTGIKYTVKD
ncbi:MAG: hypothetical protein OXS35_09515, partial [Dehalococcoidia bacterium]|nr:hypothetical protein [Dehalococcoidia bacterium]